MFPKINHIQSAYRSFRVFTLVIIGACLLFTGLVIYKSYSVIALAQNRVYILANGKAMEAFAADRKDNIPVEARDHVRAFHERFFTLDPDDQVIQTNIGKALYLADATAKKQYEALKENGYYSTIISGNVSQHIAVDSVRIDVNQYPFYFRCYATQEIIRPTSRVWRTLVTEGYLRNVSRSDNNPHGFLIERWNTIENKDTKMEQR